MSTLVCVYRRKTNEMIACHKAQVVWLACGYFFVRTRVRVYDYALALYEFQELR